MSQGNEWTVLQSVALWCGITLVVLEGEVLVASLLGYAAGLVEAAKAFTAFIGPMWPLLGLTSLLVVSTTLALFAHRAGLMLLDRPCVAIDLLTTSGQWGMIAGLLGTFIGIVDSILALDPSLDQQQLILRLLRATGNAVGSTAYSTAQWLVVSAIWFGFARVARIVPHSELGESQ
jgi:hypothetical protein